MRQIAAMGVRAAALNFCGAPSEAVEVGALYDQEMTRIRGPVGLNIEAVTAPEIALSIMAEVVAAHRGSPLGQKQPADSNTMKPAA